MSEPAMTVCMRQIHFGDHDIANIRALAPIVRPARTEIVARFYDRLMADSQAQRIFTGGAEQIDRLKQTLTVWLDDLLTGSYGPSYWSRRTEIGAAHVRVGLPVHYMLVGMEILWQEIQDRVHQAGVPHAYVKLHSLHKLLSLETIALIDSYQARAADRIRHEERSMAEEKVTRSEHLAQLGQLAASLAHEIKNPLAGISGAIQVIRDGLTADDPRRGVIRDIIGQINRLDAAVKDLLVYARPKPPEFSPCHLPAVLDNVLKMMRDAPALQSVRIDVQTDGHVPPIPADNRQIEQLMMNLLFNAAHACEPGGRIEVVFSSTETGIRMVITDHGEGMDDAVRDRAFEPFFTTKAKGTGLGLPICRKIVEAHDGTIDLQSRRGRGTCVTVSFPAPRESH